MTPVDLIGLAMLAVVFVLALPMVVFFGLVLSTSRMIKRFRGVDDA